MRHHNYIVVDKQTLLAFRGLVYLVFSSLKLLLEEQQQHNFCTNPFVHEGNKE